MRTRAQGFASILIAIAICLNGFGQGILHAYFSDSNQARTTINTGSVDVEISSLSCFYDSNLWSLQNQTLNNTVITANTAVNLSLTVANTGKSTIDFYLVMELAFLSGISEGGKLLLYPQSTSTADILQSISNNYENAIISADVVDTNHVQTPVGTQQGISKTVFQGVLPTSQQQDVEFTLFFSPPSQQLNTSLAINLIAVADVFGRNTAWQTADMQGFTATTLDTRNLITKIAGGNSHVLALTGDGRVYAWGRNVDGQLGLGHKQNMFVPTLVPTLSNIVDISACNSSSFALSADGTLYSWGHNGYGHLGDGTLNSTLVPIPITPPQGVVFSKIFARYNTAGAVTSSGDAYVWGYGNNGQMGNGLAQEKNPTPIKLDIENVASLDFGYLSASALTTDGRLYTWGSNVYGTLGLGISDVGIFTPTLVPMFSQPNSVVEVNLGHLHAVARTPNNQMYAWGYGQNGRLGNGETVQQNSPQLVNLTGEMHDVAGGYSNSATIIDGDVYVFGDNLSGALGNELTDILEPILLEGVSGATQVLLLPSATLIIVDYQTVYGLGINSYGILGNGTQDDTTYPTEWLFEWSD